MMTQHSLARIVGLLGLCALLVAGTGVTSAQSTAPPNPAIDDDQVVHASDILVEYFEEITPGLPSELTETGTQASIQSNPCLTYTHGVNGLTPTGTMLYQWKGVVGWCFDNQQITYVNAYYVPSTAEAAIFFEEFNRNDQYTPNNTTFQTGANGKFGSLCAIPQFDTCVLQHFPRVDITVHADGRYSGSGNP